MVLGASARSTPLGGFVLLTREQQVLLVKQAYGLGLWALPGGLASPGETVEAAAIREANEETGLDVELGGVVGIPDRGSVVLVVFAGSASSSWRNGGVHPVWRVRVRRITGGPSKATSSGTTRSSGSPVATISPRRQVTERALTLEGCADRQSRGQTMTFHLASPARFAGELARRGPVVRHRLVLPARSTLTSLSPRASVGRRGSWSVVRPW